MPREEFPCHGEQERDRNDRGRERKSQTTRKKRESNQNSEVQLLNRDDCFTENSLLFSAMRRDGLIILPCITRTHNRRLLAAFME